MNTPTPKKLWVSKYWLSVGIQCADWDGKTNRYGGVRLEHWNAGRSMFIERDVHETEAEALAMVAVLRAKKITALRKQIAKLEAQS